MRSVNYIICLCAIFFLGACNKKTIQINGHIDPVLDLNGRVVELVMSDGDEERNFYTQIENNKFSFKKHFKNEHLAVLSIDDFGDFTICVEHGKVDLTYFPIDSISLLDNENTAMVSMLGTPNNNIINTYNSLEYNAFSQIAAAASDEQVSAIMARWVEQSYNLVIDNVNSIGAAYIITYIYSYLTTPQKDIIFRQLDLGSFSDSKMCDMLSTLVDYYHAEKQSAVGQRFLDFEVVNRNSEVHKISEYIGKTDYVLIDFWATWCAPCLRLMPSLGLLHNKYNSSRQLQVISVSLDDSSEEWSEFLSSNSEYDWLQFLPLSDSIPLKYAVTSIPNTILIDKNGIIVAKNPDMDSLEVFLK